MAFNEITWVMSPNTMTKLHRDEQVMLNVLDNICDTLGRNYGDVMDFVPDKEGAIIHDR
jgi:DNA-binding Xre family transcriptional regulator